MRSTSPRRMRARSGYRQRYSGGLTAKGVDSAAPVFGSLLVSVFKLAKPTAIWYWRFAVIWTFWIPFFVWPGRGIRWCFRRISGKG